MLMVGDVVGAPGRKVLKYVLPSLRKAAQLDFVTINAENLAGGFGVTEKTYREMLSAGVDAVTMGNHWHDKPDVHTLRREATMILPQNLPNLEGVDVIPSFQLEQRKKTISVINLMGLFAMKDSYDNPYEFLQREREKLTSRRESGQHIYIVDIHAEGTAEKQVMGWYLNGIAAAVIGTHTHTPTSDERILSKGTALLTDVGMTGPYESVIGMTVPRSLARYFPPVEKKAQEVAERDLWFCGFLVEISPQTCLALRAHRLQFRMSEQRWVISTSLASC